MTPLVCTLKELPPGLRLRAAQQAITLNPANAPKSPLPPEKLALLTAKYWGRDGVRLTVGFLDNPPADLRARILAHMNAWAATANVRFTETASNPQVRVTRGEPGNWSYLGTDVLLIPAPQPTMNLGGFTMNTPESEFVRVVRHETGHTLGFPHEHKRREIVERIDRDKAIRYFGGPPNNWTPAQVIEQVLTPLDNSALIATEQTDPTSIMCYWLPAEIMKDGVAVTGGRDINVLDARFAGLVYPLPTPPDWPPPNLPPGYPPITHWGVFLRIRNAAGPLPREFYPSDEVEVMRGPEALHRWHYNPNFGAGWYSWTWPVEDMTWHADGYALRIHVPAIDGRPPFLVMADPETATIPADPFWKGTLNPRPPQKPNWVRLDLQHPADFVCHCAVALDVPSEGISGLTGAQVSAGGIALAEGGGYYRGTLPAGAAVLGVGHPRYRLAAPVTLAADRSHRVERVTLVRTA